MRYSDMLTKTTKILAIILTAGLLSLLPTACNKSGSDAYNPAEISHFGFDSFPDFKDYTFYIDHFGSKIYNEDSLPFASDVDSLFPTITAVSTNDKITIDGEAWSSKEYRDWSSGGPFELVNHSEDGLYTKTYWVYVNKHQVDPDSMQSSLRTGNYPAYEGEQKVLRQDQRLHCFYVRSTDSTLAHYQSTDGINWSAAAEASGLEGEVKVASICAYRDSFYLVNTEGSLFASGDFINWTKDNSGYSFINLYGELRGRKHLSNNALIAIIEDTATQVRHFARFEDAWTLGDSVPSDFPVDKYASVQSTTVTDIDYLVVTTGLDRTGQYAKSTWSTMDGLYWARISNNQSSDLLLQGASMFYYDGDLYLLGGMNEDGAYHDLYISENQGINWELAENRKQLKAIDEEVVNAQIFCDDAYIYVYGGNSGSDKKMWRACLNRMLFIKK